MKDKGKSYWHATSTTDIDRILREGLRTSSPPSNVEDEPPRSLTPRIHLAVPGGKVRGKLKVTKPFLRAWFGGALFEVKVPKGTRVHRKVGKSGTLRSWERVVYTNIPSENLRRLK